MHRKEKGRPCIFDGPFDVGSAEGESAVWSSATFLIFRFLPQYLTTEFLLVIG